MKTGAVQILILLFLSFCFNSSTQAQEGLYDVRYSQAEFNAYMNLKKSMPSSRSSNVNIKKFIYIIDTLNLPFFDDFTTNRIKDFNASITDNNISLKINYDFTVNGDGPPRLEFMNDTTRSKVKTLGGEIIEYPNPVLYITLYNNGNPIGADTGWTNVITEFDQSEGTVEYDTLLPDEILTNQPDTFYQVADDRSLWLPPLDTFDSVKSAPFINNDFAKNQITQGVATFDGTDRFGFPYDITSETAHGEADLLTSKPIGLDSNMTDVFLSFFYQAGGNGNLPEEEDSLIVEFFDVIDSTWRFAWKGVAPNLEDSMFSEQVFIHIDGRSFLQSGFRFRFRNYATLSGSLDHWHIDYIRLGENRDSTLEDTIPDVAFLNGIRSFLDEYTSVPYDHYLSSPTYFEADKVSTLIRNLGSDSLVLQGLRYEVFDLQNNLVFDEITSDPNISAFTTRAHDFPLSGEGLFPDLNTESADFEIRSRYGASSIGNAHLINDTIYTYQHFRNYYAYDDGIAEKAYALTGAGLKLAYEFNIPSSDTLEAIYFNFPQTLHNENEDLLIEILVWDDIENDPIYVAEQLIEPKYTKAGQFFRVKMEDPVNVGEKFYVGFRQIEATKVYIGFDVNTDASSHINYQINDQWYESSFEGALMIRPHFGNVDLLDAHEVTAHKKFNRLRLYPNPANDHVTIDLEDQELKTVQVFDLSGRLVLESGTYQTQINTMSLKPGVYIVKVMTNGGSSLSEKLIISRR